jgi:hypothetical protein
MNFAHSREAQEFANAVREALSRQQRAGMRNSQTDTEYRGTIWTQMAELGVAGMAIAQRLGGTELPSSAVTRIMEELGKACVADIFIDSSVVAPELLTSAGSSVAEELCERIVAGQIRVGVLFGDAMPYVAHLDALEIVLETQNGRLFATEPDQGRYVLLPSIDDGCPVYYKKDEASVRVIADLGPVTDSAITRAQNRGALAVAAASLGAATRMIELAREYATTREQFGRPIGSFQAVQHRLVDAYIRVLYAGPVLYAASMSDGSDQTMEVSKAKRAATRAARAASRAALQVHGAIGFTHEYDLSVIIARTMTLAQLYGDDRWHTEKLVSHVKKQIGAAICLSNDAN